MPNLKPSEDLNYDYADTLDRGKIFDEYKPKHISGRRYEKILISSDGCVIKLIDREQSDMVSLVAGEFITYFDKEYFQIRWTYSKFKKRGFQTYLFKLIIYDLKYIVISDKVHTKSGSKDFWKSLIRNKEFTIYLYNTETNYKRLANGFKDEDIWYDTSKHRELVDKDVIDTESIIESDQFFSESVVENDEISEEERYKDLEEEYDLEDVSQLFQTNSKTKESIRLIAQINKA